MDSKKLYNEDDSYIINRFWSGRFNMIEKAKVYIKNPQDAPKGVKVEEGERGGHYYESQQHGKQSQPQESKPKIQPTELKLKELVQNGIIFQTGLEIAIPYLYNREKSPDFGSRFGQDIEPYGKYVILEEPGSIIPPSWERSTAHLRHPLVIEWTDWKRRLSEHYGGARGKKLTRSLLAGGYDSIVTIDNNHTSEIILLHPQRTYEELINSENYKGKQLTETGTNYDVFQFNDVIIKVNSNDIPSNIELKIDMATNVFRFADKLKKKPQIILLGKSIHNTFNWTDNNGQKHNSEYGGHANYDANEIAVYDDFGMIGIIHHEVGHFVHKKLMEPVEAVIDAPLRGFEHVENIKLYAKMVEILQNHNVPIDVEHIRKVLDDINYARNLGIMEDMHRNNLQYYDQGYNALFAIEQRLKAGYTPDLSEWEVKQHIKYRKERKAEFKINIMQQEWKEIWQTEGFPDNVYASRNTSECFAEFYQTMDNILRERDLNWQKHLFDLLVVKHPKKYDFFKKYVFKKWLK